MVVAVDSDTYSGFPADLYDTATYYIRVKTWDKWLPNSPFYSASTVNFSHECVYNVLSIQTALPALLTYTVKASGTTAVSANQQGWISASITDCSTTIRLKTSIELFEDGEWKTIRDDSGAAVGPCAGATT